MSWWGSSQKQQLDMDALETEFGIMNDLFQK
jgi:hypothetical protein